MLLAGFEGWVVLNQGLGDGVLAPGLDHLDVLYTRVVLNICGFQKRNITENELTVSESNVI